MICAPRSLLACLLSLVLAVTGLQAASARGHATPVGAVELCLGATVVTVLVDASGTPVEHVQLCPDGALLLFAATGSASDHAVPMTHRARSVACPEGSVFLQAAPPTAQARGPPAVL
jgi:hypothetical protein